MNKKELLNSIQKYLFYAVQSILNNGGTPLVARMPYDNKQCKAYKALKIKYVAKNYKISDRFKEVLERKLEKLDKYFPKGCDAKVNCTEQNDIEKLEITLNADNIIVFPNNKNIILAANQAAKIYTDSKVTVIETKTISQGYSALTMMDLSLELDEIIEYLKEVIKNVVSAQITYSVRDTVLAGLKISKGDFIGLCESKIVTSRRSRTDAVKDLLRQSGAAEKDSLTIIYGSDVNEKEVSSIQRHVEKNYDNLEVDVIKGDQDVYSYIFVLE